MRRRPRSASGWEARGSAKVPALNTATSERLARWVADPDVLGVLLVGSKAAGHDDSRSDDDLEVLLTEAALARLAPAECHEALIEGEGAARRIVYDAQLLSLAALERKAGSPQDLDRWPYEQVGILHARDARVERAVVAAATMSREFRAARLAHSTIDAWVAAHRARKTFDRGFRAAGAMLVTRGAKALGRVLFALEHRWTPLDHWLECELATLEDPLQIGPRLIAALTALDPTPLAEAVAALEDRLAEEGVPRPAQRTALFLELIHASRVDERSQHALP
jgi:hypothetical protein